MVYDPNNPSLEKPLTPAHAYYLAVEAVEKLAAIPVEDQTEGEIVRVTKLSDRAAFMAIDAKAAEPSTDELTIK